MADTTAPKLKSLVLPATLDVSSGSGIMAVSAEASDEGGSGVDRVAVSLDGKFVYTYGASSNISIPDAASADTFHDGTPNSASTNITLTDRTSPGTYNVTNVYVYDMAGNVATYTGTQLRAMGIQTSMQVTGGKLDTTAPVLQKLILPDTIDLSKGPQEILVGAQAQDNAGGSGIDRVSVLLDGKLGFTYGAYSIIGIESTFGQDTFQDSTPDSASQKITLTTATAPGTYQVTDVLVYDRAGNVATYSAAQLRALGIQTSMQVTGSVADRTAPVLQKLTLPNTVDLSKGSQEIVVSVQAHDEGGSGVSDIAVYLDGKLGYAYGSYDNMVISGGYGQDTFSDSTPDTANNKFTLTTATPAGTYHVTQVRVTDLAGNVATYTGAQLAALGIQTEMTVTNGSPVPAEPAPSVPEPTVPTPAEPAPSVPAPVVTVPVVPVPAVPAPVAPAPVVTPPVASVPATPVPAPDFPSMLSIYAHDDDTLSLSILSKAWKAGASTSFALTLTYDARAATYTDASMNGAASSAMTASVSEAGGVATVTLTGSAMPDSNGFVGIAVTLHPRAAGANVGYAVASFTIGGQVQSFFDSAVGVAHMGGTQDDTIAVDAGQTLIDAGKGIDTAVFAQAASAYVVKGAPFAFRVDDFQGHGVTLQGVERLQFADTAMALDVNGNGTGGQVYRLYQAAFDRTPDKGGLGYWIYQREHGTTLTQAARLFIDSKEFGDTYGANVGTDGFITALYRNVLHRTPDQAGFDYWNKVLGDGAQRADVLRDFSESTENVAQVVGVIQNGFAFTPWH